MRSCFLFFVIMANFLMANFKRITIYVDHVDSSDDYDLMQGWLLRWQNIAKIENYSTGGWEHIWDIEAPIEAIEEIPKEWFCASDWTGFN